jgi:hypothetical protein
MCQKLQAKKSELKWYRPIWNKCKSSDQNC